nr:MAG TPA: hypothetical protein [Caudoviricetes sp.]
MYRGEIVKKARPLIDKFNEKGYSDDAYKIMGFLAFGTYNDGNEEKTIEKFIELLDTTSNEDDFLLEATKYLGF